MLLYKIPIFQQVLQNLYFRLIAEHDLCVYKCTILLITILSNFPARSQFLVSSHSLPSRLNCGYLLPYGITWMSSFSLLSQSLKMARSNLSITIPRYCPLSYVQELLDFPFFGDYKNPVCILLKNSLASNKHPSFLPSKTFLLIPNHHLQQRW